jgi:hypothetical protein
MSVDPEVLAVLRRTHLRDALAGRFEEPSDAEVFARARLEDLTAAKRLIDAALVIAEAQASAADWLVALGIAHGEGAVTIHETFAQMPEEARNTALRLLEVMAMTAPIELAEDPL